MAEATIRTAATTCEPLSGRDGVVEKRNDLLPSFVLKMRGQSRRVARRALQMVGEQPIILKLRQEVCGECRQGIGALRKKERHAILLCVLGCEV